MFYPLQKAYDGILKEREAHEKQQRARVAREKHERERAERVAKKKALVDFNAPDDQRGVMDSLLEALQTGTAFSMEQKRKRAPRAAGGKKSIHFSHMCRWNLILTLSYIFVLFLLSFSMPDPELQEKLDAISKNLQW